MNQLDRQLDIYCVTGPRPGFPSESQCTPCCHVPAASVALILGPILLDIYITYLAFSFLIKFKQQREVGIRGPTSPPRWPIYTSRRAAAQLSKCFPVLLPSPHSSQPRDHEAGPALMPHLGCYAQCRHYAQPMAAAAPGRTLCIL